MLINTLGYTAFLGALGLIRLRTRYDRIVSWLMFFATAFLFFEYGKQILMDNVFSFSFLWNKSSVGDIIISFKPDRNINKQVIALFFLSVVTIFNNNIFRFEEKRSVFNAFILLNFVVQSLLISAENSVQLITSVFVSDILGYLVLKDVDSSHRYVIYNFFADMCLFMVLALACGKLQSLELSQFFLYKVDGRHKDFVAFMIILALFVKMGAAMFQSYLLDVSAARFQRMSAVNLLFAPLSSLFLFIKLNNLLQISDLFAPIMTTESLLTLAVGISGFVIKNHIRRKMVYLNMAFFGLLMQMLQASAFVWTGLISSYYITIYFVNLLFFKIYLYQNREDNVDKMINAREINSLVLKTLFVQFVLLSAISFVLTLKIAQTSSSTGIVLAECLIFAAISIVLSHIYKSPLQRRLDYLQKNPLRFVSFLFNTALIILGIWLLKIKGWEVFAFIFVFIMLAASTLPSYLRPLYVKSWLQGEDLSKSLFFYTLVTPLMYLSRMLWLAVDFVFSEKIITAFVSSINRFSISLFFKINKKSFAASLMFIALGVLGFAAAFYLRGMP